jgi:hypothetical protein
MSRPGQVVHPGDFGGVLRGQTDPLESRRDEAREGRR